jgi:hypothetical protein
MNPILFVGFMTPCWLGGCWAIFCQISSSNFDWCHKCRFNHHCTGIQNLHAYHGCPNSNAEDGSSWRHVTHIMHLLSEFSQKQPAHISCFLVYSQAGCHWCHFTVWSQASWLLQEQLLLLGQSWYHHHSSCRHVAEVNVSSFSCCPSAVMVWSFNLYTPSS